MPQVGAAIAAISAVKIGGFAVGSFLLNTAASLALSTVAQALRGKPQQAGIRTTVPMIGEETPGNLIFGRYATAGFHVCPPMTRGTAGGAPNAYLTYVMELCDIPIGGVTGIWIGDEKVEILPPVAGSHYPDHNAIGGRYSGHAWFRVFNPATVPYPGLLHHTDEPRPWQDDMIGRGIPFVVMRFRSNSEVFQGLPEVLFEVTGIPLYDPRKDSSVGGSGSHRWGNFSTYEQSENPAVQVYNIKRGIWYGGEHIWGGRAPAAALPLDNWFAAMNSCDQLVDGEPRWRASFETRIGPAHFGGDSPAEVCEEILRGCSGTVAEFGGVYRIRIGGPGMPVMAFTDDDIIRTSEQVFEPFRGVEELYNTVQAQYPDPRAKWVSKEAPQRQNPSFLAEDGEVRVASLNLPATPYPRQVQRVMRAYMMDGRRQRQHPRVPLPPDFAKVEVLDAVAWNSESNGYQNKVFEVTAREDDPLSLAQSFGLRERDAGDAVWTPDMELPSPVASPTTPVPAPRTVLGFGAEPHVIRDQTGAARRSAIRLFWNPDQPDARGIRYRVRAADRSEIVDADTAELIEEGQLILTKGLAPSRRYEVQARLVSPRRTDWTDWLSVITPDIRLGSLDLDFTDFQDEIRGAVPDLFDFAGGSGSLMRGLKDEIAALRDYSTEQNLGALLEQQEIRREVEVEVDKARAFFTEQVSVVVRELSTQASLTATLQAQFGNSTALYMEQVEALSTAQFAAAFRATLLESSIGQANARVTREELTRAEEDRVLAGLIDETRASIGDAVAEANRGLASRVEDVEGELQATSEALTETRVRVDRVSADGFFRVQSTATGTSALVRLALVANVSDGVASQQAGFFIEAGTDGTNRIIAAANMFSIASGTGPNASRYVPFIVQGGVVFMDTAFIRDLTITRGKIGDEAITTFPHAYRAAEFRVTSQTSWTTVQTLSLVKGRGGPMPVFFRADVAAGTLSDLVGQIRILKNGNEARVFSLHRTAPGQEVAGPNEFTYIDIGTDIAPVTYTLQAIRREGISGTFIDLTHCFIGAFNAYK